MYNKSEASNFFLMQVISFFKGILIFKYNTFNRKVEAALVWEGGLLEEVSRHSGKILKGSNEQSQRNN